MNNIKNLFPLLFVVIFIVSVSVAARTWATSNDNQGKNSSEMAVTPMVTALVKGNTGFAIDLYGKLKEEKPGRNLFFSPTSISTALAMTYEGARGNTALQMAATLHFTLPPSDLHAAFNRLMHLLMVNRDAVPDSPVRLALANSLWPQENHRFLTLFIDTIKKYYETPVFFVNYSTETEKARQKINAWVEEKTENKIIELIQPGILSPLTCLVLVNAIYFKADWQFQFDANRTTDMPFYLSPGPTVSIPMMNIQNRFKYADFDTLQVLELPYANEQFSMQILLPKDKNNLPALEDQLTPLQLEKWTGNLSHEKVQVWLPKIKLNSTFGLENTLPGMGMKDAFDGSKADFSGMDGKKDLFISAVIHQAYIDVNEKGTEAAAATAVVMRKAGPVASPPIEFRADHPFIFLIRDQQTRSILFMGRVMNPGN